MELLNNIWALLMTPSELNTQILAFPFSFLEAYITMTLFLLITNTQASKKKQFIFVVSLTITSVLFEKLIPNPFNVLLNNAFLFLLIILLFKITAFKTLIGLVSAIAIFGISSSLISNPYVTLLNITAEELSTVPIYNIGHLVCIYAINFLIIFLLKFRKIEFNVLEDIDKKNKKIILGNFLLGVFVLIVQACIIFYFVDKLPIIITLLSCISLIAYLFISIYSLTRVMKLTVTAKKLESAEEYNKTLHILHDNVRAFKHDFDNIVTTIGGYIRTNDMEELKNYYLQLETDCQDVNNLYLLNPEVVNNPRYL